MRLCVLLFCAVFCLVLSVVRAQAPSGCLFQLPDPSNSSIHWYYGLGALDAAGPFILAQTGQPVDKGPTFYYYFCSIAGEPPTGFANITGWNATTGCVGAEAGAIDCQWGGINTKTTFFNGGLENTMIAVPQSTPANGLTITVTGGTASTGCGTLNRARMSIYTLNCGTSPTGTDPPSGSWVESSTTACQYLFTLQHAAFCGKTTPPTTPVTPVPVTPGGGGNSGPAISGGWIFIIILVGLIILYLIVGMIVKWKKYDARGLELIPNIDFWKDLPFLCKDGVMFVVNKIRGKDAYATV